MKVFKVDLLQPVPKPRGRSPGKNCKRQSPCAEPPFEFVGNGGCDVLENPLNSPVVVRCIFFSRLHAGMDEGSASVHSP